MEFWGVFGCLFAPWPGWRHVAARSLLACADASQAATLMGPYRSSQARGKRRIQAFPPGLARAVLEQAAWRACKGEKAVGRQLCRQPNDFCGEPDCMDTGTNGCCTWQASPAGACIAAASQNAVGSKPNTPLNPLMMLCLEREPLPCIYIGCS